MKLSGVARLVSSNFWVGSTLAQSPPDSTWPAPSPLPEGEQLHGPWCYRVMSYHFGKLLSIQTTLFNQIFDFGPRPRIAGVKRWGMERR